MTMQFIASATVVSSGTTTLTFNNIPQTFTHLQLRGTMRSNIAGTSEAAAQIIMNQDSGSSYNQHYLYGNGNTAASGSQTATGIYAIDNPMNNNTANCFSVGVVDVLDYTNPNKFKTVRSLTGWDANGSGFVFMFSGLWRNTAVITRIDVYEGSGFVANSRIDLYGITTSELTGA